MSRVMNVLFLCERNSARSIMAEAILTREGQGRFTAFSAGSNPADEINPLARDLLEKMNHPTAELKPKDWKAFAAAGAPQMDFVFTICDAIAGESCPQWPGTPMVAHWGMPDPIKFEGNEIEQRAVFADVYGRLANRISIFSHLPLERLDRLTLQTSLDDIGRSDTA